MGSSGWGCVVDACVALSASKGPDATASACREVLEAIQEGDHKAVLCSELAREYKLHSSKFFRKWLLDMVSHKHVVYVKGSDGGLKRAIDRGLPSKADRVSAHKDSHLVAAALQSDRIVISRDDAARDLFVVVSQREARLRHIAWLNPFTDAEVSRRGLRLRDRSGFSCLISRVDLG